MTVQEDMYFYFNQFPVLINECSHQGTFKDECLFGLSGMVSHAFPSYVGKKFWKRYYKIHEKYIKLTTKQQRALALLYDNVYNFRPNTVIGELFETCHKLYGKKTKLLIMTEHFSSVKELLYVHKNKRSRKLSDKEKQILFLLGEEIRNLYEESHNVLR